jgi:predicted enzyme related to lactoylglutathione lyase
MADQVVWFEVVGKDGNALRSFYSDLFGWQFSEPGDMDYGMVEGANGGIGGGVGSAPDGKDHLTFYVGVDDPQAALDKAEKLGGKIVMGVTEIPNVVTFALFNDPEGHLVGIVKNQPPSE